MTNRTRDRTVIPDLRTNAIKYPPPPWDSADIAKLARRHQFPDGFPLENHLQGAWEWFVTYQQSNKEPSGMEKKKYFAILAKRARMLNEALQRAGSIGRCALLDEDGSLEISAVESQLRKLKVAAMLAERNTNRSTAGPLSNWAMKSILRSTYRLYREVFGESAPMYTKNAYIEGDNKYSGPLFDLCADVLDLVGVPKSNAALGKALEKTVKVGKRQSP